MKIDLNLASVPYQVDANNSYCVIFSVSTFPTHFKGIDDLKPEEKLRWKMSKQEARQLAVALLKAAEVSDRKEEQ